MQMIRHADEKCQTKVQYRRPSTWSKAKEQMPVEIARIIAARDG